MFENNPDGAGFMYADSGRVYIRKGFMEYNEFRKAVKPFIGRIDIPMVFHFRIATHGGVNAGMCQPFPLSKRDKSLKALTTNSDIGIAHNGIIPMTMDARAISDTALFIKRYATRILSDGVDDIALDIIENCIDSKMCILEKNGKAHILGRGWSTNNGVWYSNDSYKTRYYKKSYSPKTYTSVYNYDYGFNSLGAYCDTSCDICINRKYCFDEYDDTTLTAREFEL